MLKLDHWQFGATELLLIDIQGDTRSPFVVSNVLAAALGIDSDKLKRIRNEHADRLTPISLDSLRSVYPTLREFVKENADSLGLSRVRGNVLLWPLEIALRAYKYANTTLADQFHDEGIRMIMQYAVRNSIELQEYKTRLEALEKQVRDLSPYLQTQASAAGQTLSLHRHTKDVRNLVN